MCDFEAIQNCYALQRENGIWAKANNESFYKYCAHERNTRRHWLVAHVSQFICLLSSLALVYWKIARECVCAWFRKNAPAVCRCARECVRGAKVPEWVPQSTNKRASANLHAISTCSAAGGAGGRRSSCRMLSRWFMQRATFLRAQGLKSFPRQKRTRKTPCLRINSDFSKKIIKKGAAWPHMALKVGSSINFQPRAHTSSASSVAIISWLSQFFLPGRKSAPLLINRVTHGEWSVDGIFICECDSHALCGCLIKISPMLTVGGKTKKNNKTREVDSFFWYFWSWAWLGLGGRMEQAGK
jgi:hypothetical protein